MAEQKNQALVSIGQRGVKPQDLDQLFRVANAVHQSGLAPRGLDTPQKVLVAMGHGMALGFDPFTAMTVVRVIEGSPAMSAKGVRAKILDSGATGGNPIQVSWSGTKYDDDFTCTVSTKRDGHVVSGSFSVADAKRAGLWEKRGKTGKPSGWITYPDRMLLARATGFLAQDHFGDVILGLRTTEELDHGLPAEEVEYEAAGAVLPASDPLLELEAPQPAPMPEEPAQEPVEAESAAGEPDPRYEWEAAVLDLRPRVGGKDEQTKAVEKYLGGSIETASVEQLQDLAQRLENL